MEYLVTYGWAILGIVIIAAVLFYFGIFSPQKWAPVQQQGGFASFSVVDHKIIAGVGGTMAMSIGNNRGRVVTLTQITTTTGGCTWSGSTQLGVSTATTFTTSACTGTVASATAGSPYDFEDVKITFTDSQSSLSHAETGFLKGQYQ